MKKVIILVIGILITIVVILGLVEEDTSQVNSYNDSIVYSVDSIPTRLEKITGVSKREEDILCAISRGLITKDSKGNIIPALAESYEKRDQGIEYIFKIKSDVYWSDGSNITALDVREFLKELIKSEDEANIKAVLNIYGAKEFKNGTGTFEKGVAISVEDNILKIRLNKSDDNFLNELTKVQYRIRKSLPLWRDMTGFYEDLIYSGEYYIKTMDKANIELEANPSIKDHNLKRISMIKDENKEIATVSFEFGKRDVVINPPQNELNRLSNEKKIITSPSNTALYLTINDEKDNLPLKIRAGIYKNICQSLAEYEGEFSKELEVADGSYLREDKEDLTKLQSRKVSITESEDISDPKELMVCIEENTVSKSLYEFIKEWFKKNKDIELRFVIASEDEIEQIKTNKKYDMLILKNENEKGDRQSLYKKLKEFFNKDEMSIFEKENLKGELDYFELEQKLFNDYRIVPLVFLNENICVSTKIKSIDYDYNGNLDFSTIN